jgi:hypothetical protein
MISDERMTLLQSAYFHCQTVDQMSSMLMCLEGYLEDRESAELAFVLFDTKFDPSPADGPVLLIEVGVAAKFIWDLVKNLRVPKTTTLPVVTALTEAELSAAAEARAAQIRASSAGPGGIGGDKNLAVATYDIPALGAAGEIPAVSGGAVRPGFAGVPENPVFVPARVTHSVRGTDAEYKILEDIASKLGPPSSGVQAPSSSSQRSRLANHV